MATTSSQSRVSVSSQPPRSPSPPSQTFHPSKIAAVVPTSTLLGSAAGGAHYSGAKVDHRESDVARASFVSPGPDVELDGKRKKSWDALRELYNGRPTVEIFNNFWSSDAIFENPMKVCRGIKEVASEYYSFVCPDIRSSTVIEGRVLSSTQKPNRVVVSITQRYAIRAFRISKTVKSMLIIELDDEDLIVKIEERWNGKESSKTWIGNAFRRFNGKYVNWMVNVPKDVKGHQLTDN